MKERRLASATFIGQVTSVRGSEVLVRLRDVPSTLVMVEGTSHRIGQIGSFIRIPMGYTDLFGVCTQVGADSLAGHGIEIDEFDESDEFLGYRWISMALFGEATQGRFERGDAQYPTVGDEAHLATGSDMRTIYGATATREGAIALGNIAGTPDIPAMLDLASLVTRHACVLGSTGSGKSNLMAILLRGIAASALSSARVLVIDPHGEYSTALEPDSFEILSARIGSGGGLRVPFWLLPFDELARVAFGPMSDSSAEYLRDKVRELKIESAGHFDPIIEADDVSADSPVPFSLRRLWFELRRIEDVTFTATAQSPSSESEELETGDPDRLVATRFPPAALGSGAPFLNKQKKNISRHPDQLQSRLLDPRFAFMFGTDDDYSPNHDGATGLDLDTLLASWVGHSKPLTILDVSGLPPEVVDTVVGSMLATISEALYWGMNLAIDGKRQPLLVVLDEAHRFVPARSESASSRICRRIAREGRKYGVGLMAVTQRPSDIEPTILSQCGSMIALRITNSSDRTAVSSTVPDDLGDLTALLPSLRTGECLILGEALQVPSRVRIYRAPSRPIGDDPRLPETWMHSRPDPGLYARALRGWRSQSVAPDIETD